jgi:hypothetical protein
MEACALMPLALSWLRPRAKKWSRFPILIAKTPKYIMFKWVPNTIEQHAWRSCAPSCLPPEMVERIAFYLYEPHYEYGYAEIRYFLCLKWMSGTPMLSLLIDEMIDRADLSTTQLAQQILHLYLTHPNDIVANTPEQVVAWFDRITDKFKAHL